MKVNDIKNQNCVLITIKAKHTTVGIMKVKVAQSCPTLQPYSMEFSRPEYWSGQPFPSPRDLPNPGIKPNAGALQVDSLLAEPQGKPNKYYSFSFRNKNTIGQYLEVIYQMDILATLNLIYQFDILATLNLIYCNHQLYPRTVTLQYIILFIYSIKFIKIFNFLAYLYVCLFYVPFISM